LGMTKELMKELAYALGSPEIEGAAFLDGRLVGAAANPVGRDVRHVAPLAGRPRSRPWPVVASRGCGSVTRASCRTRSRSGASAPALDWPPRDRDFDRRHRSPAISGLRRCF